ncbi:MAG: hypothetical protein Q9227_003434 [Pyrenula ochraceoflavens]
MNLLFRQIWTLTIKNLLIAYVRSPISTTFRAFILPVVFIGFLSYARNLFIPASKFGIGSPAPVRTFPDAVKDAIDSSRNRIVFVNNGFRDGDISHVIQQISTPAQAAGAVPYLLDNEAELNDVCRSSLRATSNCIGAAVFYSSPTEGPDQRWNYSIRADGALQQKIVASSDSNDVQIYGLPIQHAIDSAIASLNQSSIHNPLPNNVMQYPYTSKTAAERRDNIRVRYMGGIIDILGVAFFIGMVPIVYQMTGLIAMEREIGMAQLLDCMMPNLARWQPQAARIFAHHIAFDVLYGPGWIICAIILAISVFSKTSFGVLIIFHILTGLSTSSMSIFGAAFFHKTQLSGTSVTIVAMLLAVLAQVVGKANTGAVAILSLLFPPMNYTFFIILMARWERQDMPTNLVKSAPENPWTLPGIAFWIFMIVQILVFPILGAMIERTLYGTGSKSRLVTRSAESSDAVRLTGFSKEYRPSWIRKYLGPIFGSRRQPVLAVDNVTLSAIKGQIMILLGANGSGKSTTLDAIAGLNTVSAGRIELNYGPQGGFGLCPQKNVLWDLLTVEEHVRIFNRIKCQGAVDFRVKLRELLSACDIDQKSKAITRTLSGGQKRKVQLAMMFTGGSSICCVDEVSSGLDPISRRKIWDILLAERGKRSIILTTHFLDEADLLSDNIAILSKGILRAEGSAVEIKHRLGSGYRVYAYHVPDSPAPPHYPGILTEDQYDRTIYNVGGSEQAADLVAKLESDGIKEYQISGPTIEDVFLKVAEEVKPEAATVRAASPVGNSGKEVAVDTTETDATAKQDKPPELVTGRRISAPRQAWVLFRKRATVLRRNYLPYTAAFLIPVIASGLVTLFLKNFKQLGCSPAQNSYTFDVSTLASEARFDLVLGPPSKIPENALRAFASSLGGHGNDLGGSNFTSFARALHFVDTLDEFNTYINNNFHNVTPGGFFLGDGSSPPTFAWRGDGDIAYGMIIQNALDSLATNVSISQQYQAFDVPWAPDSGKALQLLTYLGLAFSIYPAFFALYPTVERLRNVRSLHYSNGVRSLPLWLAYVAFDFLIVLAASVISIIIFAGVSSVWYHLEYLFVVFFLYGLAATLQAYVVSLFSKSQLAAFAITSAINAVLFLLYFIAYMSILTYSPTNKIDRNVNIAHFTIAAITPIGNLTRAMFVVLNVFSLTCRDRHFASYPGAITVFGGPILYLILQSFFLFTVLLWWDSGSTFSRLRRNFTKSAANNPEEPPLPTDPDVANEISRVTSSTSNQDGLRILHLTKSFGSNLAVDNVTFSVPRGEVFALLGPNGAGKSTTISLIRGDIAPSPRTNSAIYVESVDATKHRAQARSHLGVCPQFDATDTMTVSEHLTFYARIRGVPDPAHNVREVMRAVGLQPYASRMAAKLSGGNKRKLSLAIALMGNPAVLLLDEPSSGMDAASKRVMWRTLATVVQGRSLVLTTHSMEEADALARRAGIMSGRMLALGTTEELRRRHGNAHFVHLVHKDAPHSSDKHMQRIREWVTSSFRGAVIEEKTYHGQMRFSVPVDAAPTQQRSIPEKEESADIDTVETSSITRDKQLEANADVIETASSLADDPEKDRHKPLTTTKETEANGSGISTLFTLLESHKSALGIEYYSVSQTTLDQVFLNIVGKHNVEGEDQQAPGNREGRTQWWKWIFTALCCIPPSSIGRR